MLIDYARLAVDFLVPSAPVAAFSSYVPDAGAPLAVQFIDESLDSLSLPPDSWLWEFGDGGTSTEQYPVHTYAEGGTYAVTLTATNSIGSDTATQDVSVTAPAPPPVVHVPDVAGRVGATVTRAAQAHLDGRTASARTLTHAACALIDQANNPYVTRGAVLVDLVKQYRDGAWHPGDPIPHE